MTLDVIKLNGLKGKSGARWTYSKQEVLILLLQGKFNDSSSCTRVEMNETNVELESF